MTRTVRAAMVVVALVCGAAAAAETTKKDAKPAATAPKGDPMAAMMAQMAKYSDPGENHKKLVKWFAGKWKTESKMWFTPGKPPAQSVGASEMKSVLGDRFVEQEYTGEAMHKPFGGLGLMGFDNAKQKFVALWVDTLSTWFSSLEGTLDASGKVLTFAGELFDPSVGKTTQQRWVYHFDSEAKHLVEFFGAGPDGKEFKMMEIAYTRVK